MRKKMFFWSGLVCAVSWFPTVMWSQEFSVKLVISLLVCVLSGLVMLGCVFSGVVSENANGGIDPQDEEKK